MVCGVVMAEYKQCRVESAFLPLQAKFHKERFGAAGCQRIDNLQDLHARSTISGLPEIEICFFSLIICGEIVFA
jgi:hypothetical protein